MTKRMSSRDIICTCDSPFNSSLAYSPNALGSRSNSPSLAWHASRFSGRQLMLARSYLFGLARFSFFLGGGEGVWLVKSGSSIECRDAAALDRRLIRS